MIKKKLFSIFLNNFVVNYIKDIKLLIMNNYPNFKNNDQLCIFYAEIHKTRNYRPLLVYLKCHKVYITFFQLMN